MEERLKELETRIENLEHRIGRDTGSIFSTMVCPECGEKLFVIGTGNVLYFTCENTNQDVPYHTYDFELSVEEVAAIMNHY